MVPRKLCYEFFPFLMDTHSFTFQSSCCLHCFLHQHPISTGNASHQPSRTLLHIFYVQLFPFSEPSPWPPIKDAGNRCIKADLSGWGSPAPLYQRVVRPNWGGGSKYLSFVYFHCVPVWVIITWKWLSLLIASMFIDYGNHTWALPISDLLKNL